jgi:FtsZ-binding cell division protein ZapB
METNPNPPAPGPTEVKTNMSDDAIRSLNRRIEELMTENASLKAEAKDRRISGKKLKSEVEKLTKECETLAGERDTYKTKAEAKPGELSAKIQELEGFIRTGKHKSEFVEAVKRGGLEGASKQEIDDLWTLSGYKPEGDEPDPAKLDALIASQKESRPHLFRKVETADPLAGGQPPKPKLTLPIDNSRGGGSGGGPQAFKVSSAQIQDLGWMQKNAAAIKTAKENGTLVYE